MFQIYNFGSTGSVGQPLPSVGQPVPQNQETPIFVASFDQPGFDGNVPGQSGFDGNVLGQSGFDGSFVDVRDVAPGQFAQPSSDGPFVGGFPLGSVGQSVEGFPALVSSRPQGARLPLQLVPSFVGGQASVPGGVFPGQINNAQAGFQGAGFRGAGFDSQFVSRVISQPITPTVTKTETIDTFVTLTDLVLHSVPVTQTQFSLLTTTQLTRVVSISL